MYEIRPESLTTFIEARIKLPRFQRKQSWNDRKNFELCISLFKGFPIGVCIIQEELTENGPATYWLLDGRQRREALKRLNENPESVYEWARKWISFKVNDDWEKIESKFWESVNEYLEKDDIDEDELEPSLVDPEYLADSETISNTSEDDGTELDDLEALAPPATEKNYLAKVDGLQSLLDIIKIVHPRKVKKERVYSNFTAAFDFSKFLPKLPYMRGSGKNKAFDGIKLRKYIGLYLDEVRDTKTSPESLVEFWCSQDELEDSIKKSFLQHVQGQWPIIDSRLMVIQKLKDRLDHSKIGYIEVKNVRSADAQKIFNIINSSGTALTAAEVLSAKPSWNVPISDPCEEQQRVVRELYAKIGTNYDFVAKWDLAASILYRVPEMKLFINYQDKDPKQSQRNLDKRTTLGFKLLSGLFQGGIKKEDIENLSRNTKINWSDDFESLVEDLRAFSGLIKSAEYFRFLQSWRVGITDLMSDAVALNFVLLMYKDWDRKGKPTGKDIKSKQVQKNAFILLDRLFYEYVNREWRGSSDSRIANNIKNFVSEDALLSELPSDSWEAFLDNLFATNSIRGTKIKPKDMKPLLYHLYALNMIKGPREEELIEIDHIFPQSLFKVAKFPDGDAAVHNLFNLALLPKKENISKGDKALKDLSGDWLKQVVSEYALIPQDEFKVYSDLSNWEKLRESRGKWIIQTFTQDRSKFLLK